MVPQPNEPESTHDEAPAGQDGRLNRLRRRAVTLKDSSTRQIGAARARHPSVDFVLATGERDRILGGSLVAGAIAFRLFLMMVPMMVVVVAVVGLVKDVSSLSSEQLVAKLGMVGYVADSVADASKLSTGSAWTVLVVALWILFLTAGSFARALRTAHALAWGQPIRRWPHGAKARLAVIGFMLVLLVLVGLMNSMRTGTIVSTIGVAIATGMVMAGLWMLASRFLPRAGDRWLDLLPGALFVGFGVQLVNIGVIYFTWRATRAQAFYGPLGLAIVMLVWLYIMSRLLIGSAVINSQRYTRRTGLSAVPTVLTAVDDAVAGVDAGARLAAPGADGPAGQAAPDAAVAAESATGGEVAAETAAGGELGEPATKKPKKPHRGRRITAVTLVILAAIVSVIMMVSVWAHDFLLNTDTFVTTVAPVLKDPQVTQSIGATVARRTIALTDAEQRLKDVLPPRLQFIAAPVVGQVEHQLAKGTTKLLRTEKGYAAWERILRFTHRSVVAVLRDESKYLNIHGDQVRLDLLPLVVVATNRLDDLLPDVIAERAPLPDLTTDRSPEEQRTELAQALGKPVSPDFAQVILFRGEQVQTAQQALKLFDLLAYVLIALTAILVIAAVIVSPRRLRTLVHLGIAAVIAVIITRVAVNQVQGAVLDAAAGTSALPLIKAGVGAVFHSLQNLIIWGLVAGAIVGVLAYLAGRPRRLIRLGARLVVWGKAAGTWGQASGTQAAEDRDPALDWIRAHRDPLLVGITVAAVVLLLLLTSSLGGAIAIIVVAGLLVGGAYWVGRTAPGAGAPADDTREGGPAGDVTATPGTAVSDVAATDKAPGDKPAPAKRRPAAKGKGATT